MCFSRYTSAERRSECLVRAKCCPGTECPPPGEGSSQQEVKDDPEAVRRGATAGGAGMAFSAARRWLDRWCDRLPGPGRWRRRGLRRWSRREWPLLMATVSVTVGCLLAWWISTE